MNLDFMSLKTTSLASVKSERQKEKMLERQKAREIEQVGGINAPTFFYILLMFYITNWIKDLSLSMLLSCLG